MVLDRIKELVAEGLDIEIDTIDISSNLADDLGADSLDAVEIIMLIEEEFEIEIDDDSAQKIKTIEDIVKYVEENM